VILLTGSAELLIKFTTHSPVDGVVEFKHPTDDESRQEITMDPISITVVIVALVALAC
jgi:hypothetical protein